MSEDPNPRNGRIQEANEVDYGGDMNRNALDLRGRLLSE
jgi:hypothetical protein